MSIGHLLRTPCTVKTPTAGGVDEYGNDTAGTPDVVTTVCHIQPLTSDEMADRPDGTVKWRGWFSPDLTIRSTSALTVGGVTFQAVGPPRPWAAPGQPTAYVEVDLADRSEV